MKPTAASHPTVVAKLTVAKGSATVRVPGEPRVTVVIVTIEGLETRSEANTHEHWRGRWSRARRQRGTTERRVSLAIPNRADLFRVTQAEARLVRLGPGRGRGLDSDNLAGALKAVRDGVADAVAIDDGDARWTWTYAQERAPRPGVRIELTLTEETTTAWA